MFQKLDDGRITMNPEKEEKPNLTKQELEDKRKAYLRLSNKILHELRLYPFGTRIETLSLNCNIDLRTVSDTLVIMSNERLVKCNTRGIWQTNYG